jgi:thioredoxin 1
VSVEEKKKRRFPWWLLLVGALILGANEWRASGVSLGPMNSEAEFKNALQSGRPVLVDFGSNSCVPCRQMRPILREISEEFSGKATVLIIDVNKHNQLASEYRIQLIPTLIFFNSKGQEVYRHTGTSDKDTLVKKLRDTA